eukprot:1840-Heterococcus_DN1.PRE.1
MPSLAAHTFSSPNSAASRETAPAWLCAASHTSAAQPLTLAAATVTSLRSTSLYEGAASLVRATMLVSDCSASAAA